MQEYRDVEKYLAENASHAVMEGESFIHFSGKNRKWVKRGTKKQQINRRFLFKKT